ncbi:UDP-N-acetylglucosamine diphosphorylase Uap1/Qri1(predicted) [Schizosaccharomyces pombe]|uniref:Probable UDP-N-acetylglucosamine pyrophosphorylase n=1 Tax=Schizosaccharomyces pombe (strain 972 / ATCC 24843) TaxID=284812 RepID=UAP1_SCHPO|nr:putative UDP-N-acetylglucosamine diphosphorylase Uap1/Qri1(predicted) [Schizosaccharomyces pombe]O94617.1 RecName: Full=Probable UDP-N-acetylglucosamine pyrophosphorylase [Schizosaccharomyces pombe 972h-]CAB38688.1 UDP-N-acetylglucosamine diphosphorylase Uap1/Qri1(predicted) [Schizosaccharomyces pombe]|eukprot:NP_596832.1 putative UDP-N-acetylglucosamine diphosphorylase Uap1/Qri1(predicted) [Schizosaccharomyces pombe]
MDDKELFDRSIFEETNQLHLYDQLNYLKKNDLQKFRKLLNQVQQLDLRSLWLKYRNAKATSQENRKLSPSEVGPLSIVDTSDSSWWRTGLREIARGHVAALVLAGGQGTRLGFAGPKGCFRLGLPNNPSIFELQAQKIKKSLALARAAFPDQEASISIPWYIMVSECTSEETISFFKENDFFGIDKKDVFFFQQGVLPCLDISGRVLFESDSSLAWAPNGNGGIYEALLSSGALNDMNRRGILHITAYSVDNVLVLPVDPVFIGMATTKKLEVATKTVEKIDPAEKVGLLVSSHNHPCVVEYSEISDEACKATENVDGHKHLLLRAANIAYHYFSFDFLQKASLHSSTLPIHLACKKIPFYDVTSHHYTTPLNPNGYKLESFIFDLFPSVSVENFGCFQVPRRTSFSPLKNSSKSPNDNHETCVNDILSLGKSWILKNGGILSPSDCTYVSPECSLQGESLEWIKGKQVSNCKLY